VGVTFELVDALRIQTQAIEALSCSQALAAFRRKGVSETMKTTMMRIAERSFLRL
jgi:hypothetical protein